MSEEGMEFKIGVFHQGEDTEIPFNWIVWDSEGDEVASNWEPTQSEAVKAACDYIIENT